MRLVIAAGLLLYACMSKAWLQDVNGSRPVGGGRQPGDAVTVNGNDHDERKGMRLEMIHADSLIMGYGYAGDSMASTSRMERLRRGLERSERRWAEIMMVMMAARGSTDDKSDTTAVAAAVSSTGTGEYMVGLELGTPPQTVTAVLDTGSDLVWVSVAAASTSPTTPGAASPSPYPSPASSSDGGQQPQEVALFDPDQSSTYRVVSCRDQACSSNMSLDSACGLDYGSSSACGYIIQYGSGTVTGVLGHDRLSIAGMSAGGFLFGATPEEDTTFILGGSAATGLLGMGRGPLSLPSQMAAFTDARFSYCLVSWTDAPEKSSPLLFGSQAAALIFDTTTAAAAAASSSDSVLRSDSASSLSSSPSEARLLSTPFVKGGIPSFYYLSLSGLSVGGRRLDLPDGTFGPLPEGNGGGFIIDSGTTLSYLVEPAYSSLRAAYVAAIGDGLPSVNASTSVGLDLCYDTNRTTSVYDVDNIPTLTLHLDGADLSLPFQNTFMDLEGGLLCLAFMPSPFPISILGNFQQQNFHILFDTGPANQLSLQPAICDAL